MTLPNSSSDRIGRLFRYWTELRTDGAVPGIATFDPLHVADLMPNLWMAGWKQEVGDFVYRVAGDAILTTVDRPMHHRSLREIYPAALADRLRERHVKNRAGPGAARRRPTLRRETVAPLDLRRVVERRVRGRLRALRRVPLRGLREVGRGPRGRYGVRRSHHLRQAREPAAADAARGPAVRQTFN